MGTKYQHPGSMSYAIPAAVAGFEKGKVYFSVERTLASDTRPMKLVARTAEWSGNLPGGWLESDELESDDFAFEFDLSAITTGFFRIGHNRNNNESASFTINVSRIEFTKDFVSVDDITGVPTEGFANFAVDFSNVKVEPTDATEKDIVWEYKLQTAPTFDPMDIVAGKFTFENPGIYQIRATIVDAVFDEDDEIFEDFVKTFTITIEDFTSLDVTFVVVLDSDEAVLDTGVVLRKVAGTDADRTKIFEYDGEGTAEWFLNGELVGTDAEYEAKAADLAIRTHVLRLEVELDGRLYSKTITFRVTL